MKEMFDALYRRLEHKASGDPFGDSRWTPIVPGYKLPTMVQCSEWHYTYYYPPSLLKYMESKIACARNWSRKGPCATESTWSATGNGPRRQAG